MLEQPVSRAKSAVLGRFLLGAALVCGMHSVHGADAGPAVAAGGNPEAKAEKASGRWFARGKKPQWPGGKQATPPPASAEAGAPKAGMAPTNQPDGEGPPPAVATQLPPTPQAPPTPEAVEEYRTKLESRLLERYANMPEYAGKVAKVTAVLSKPLEYSMDGGLIRAEFDQLVHDTWGKRLPALEKEYYVVTFGAGGALQVRTDPSIRVGLDHEKTYSEKAPLVADPFRNIEEYEAFSDVPTVKMPEWWRPDFPELR